MKCFTCSECCTNNCPNIQYDMAGDYADDIGLEKIKCKNCRYNTGKCEDCLGKYYPELCDDKKENEKGVLEQMIAKTQKTLLDSTKAWSNYIDKNGNIY